MSRPNNKGFTLSELVVVMLMSSILIITLFVFTSSTINSFLKIQAQGLASSRLSDSSFRVSRVIRGSNYIEVANQYQITAYAYFSPQDAYTSKVSYYLNGAEDKLLADVTPMTADYPIGTLIAAQKKTVVIVDNFYKLPGFPAFKYYTSNFTELSSPVSDLQAIKNININLYTKVYQSSATDYTSSSVSVNLRNRKTNL
jgi:prepilin-type N-terminal cleavage/methylation domain-containing protein